MGEALTSAATALLVDICTELARQMPRSSSQFVLKATLVGGLAEITGGPDEAHEGLTLPNRVEYLLRRLRGEMYVPDEGTWWHAEIRVDGSGRYSGRFHSLTQPTIAGRPAPVSELTADLTRYPRAEAHQPAWLQTALST